MKEFYDNTCVEFMGKDDVSADDPQAFISLWHKNIQWLRDVAADVDQSITAYASKYFE